MDMTTEQSLLLIDEIGMALMTFDAADLPATGELLNKLDELKRLLPESDGELQNFVDNSKSLLSDVIMEVSKKADADIEQATSNITAIQGKLQEMDYSDHISGDSSLSSKSVETDSFLLPDWVDEAVFEEFLTNQRMVMEEIENDIIELESGDTACLAELRRRIHTLKGEAGVIGLDALSDVCHRTEDFLRDFTPSPEAIDGLLQVKDWISRSLQSYAKFQFPETSPEEIIDYLKKCMEAPKEYETDPAEESSQSGEADEETPQPVVPAEDEETQVDADGGYSSDPGEALNLPQDEESLSMLGDFISESEDGLGQADQILLSIEKDDSNEGQINSLFRVFHSLKGVAGFLQLHDVESLAHKTETLLNRVRQGEIKIEGANLDLIFDATGKMRDLLVSIKSSLNDGSACYRDQGLPPLLERIQAAIDGKIQEAQETATVRRGEKIGDILQQHPFQLDKNIVDDALKKQMESGRMLGEELIADGRIQPKKVAQALRAQTKADFGATKLTETIKVNLDRIESLMELVGELVITESMIIHDPEIVSIQSTRVSKHLGQMSKITHDLQSMAMSMRMVHVREVFQKMARLVRDLTRKNGKKITFRTSGEGTEMDRSLVERVGDPLVHMIRNAVDHGIDTPEERRASGKPEMGTINLSAYHEGSHIVIELSDDGRGLNRDAILKKAITQGIVKESDNLSDAEIHQLIFKPGFSTAEKVTEVSGRGVGMDVVMRNLQEMRGRIHIDTKLGKGTTFRIILPLTTAIINGMLVLCDNERYIIPTTSILESIRPTSDMLSTLAGEMEIINVRGESLPLLRTGKLFHIENAEVDPTKALVVIIESFERKLALMVDDVESQQSVVIKSLGTLLGGGKYFSGGAILSDGRVGLILNLDEIGKSINQEGDD
jgi:two-component system, chemotaxis family, sensor kinase CheA